MVRQCHLRQAGTRVDGGRGHVPEEVIAEMLSLPPAGVPRLPSSHDNAHRRELNGTMVRRAPLGSSRCMIGVRSKTSHTDNSYCNASSRACIDHSIKSSADARNEV